MLATIAQSEKLKIFEWKWFLTDDSSNERTN